MTRINRNTDQSLLSHGIYTVRNLTLKAALLQCIEFQLGSAFHVLYNDSSIKFCYSYCLLYSRFFCLMFSSFNVALFWVDYLIPETWALLLRLPLV